MSQPKFPSVRCGSAEIARLLGVPRWWSEKPCPNGHIGWRSAEKSRCFQCKKFSLGHRSGSVKTRQREPGAVPAWLTREHLEEMAAIYERARALTAETGVRHVVDHIDPIKGLLSCGLHVPWNLQILTRSENRLKANHSAEVFALLEAAE